MRPVAGSITKFPENLPPNHMTAELKEALLNKPVTFAVLGPVGVGKSTFSEVLGSELGIPVVEEKYMNNPHLIPFYENPSKYSFLSQMTFLYNTTGQLVERGWEIKQKSVLIDAGNEMNLLYAKTHLAIGWMTKAQFRVYEDDFDALHSMSIIKRPDIFFCLDAELPVLTRRIRKRIETKKEERSFEEKILSEYPYYLSELRFQVGQFRNGSKNAIYVDANNDNFIDKIHIDGLMEKIKRNLWE